MCVLDDAGVVDHRQEVIVAKAGRLRLEADHRLAPRPELDRVAKHLRSGPGNRRPADGLADAPSFGAGGAQQVWILDEAANGCAEGSFIAKGNERTGAGRKHVLGVAIRRRHDGAARGDRERQGA